MPARLILLLLLFVVCTGMRLYLNDGNYIEVDRYQVVKDKVLFRKAGVLYALPRDVVNEEMTARLNDIDITKLHIFNPLSSLVTGDMLPPQTPAHGDAARPDATGPRLRLETRKDDAPYVPGQRQEQPGQDPFDRLLRKGLMIKIDVPTGE